jgi:hypothetical protein
MITEITYRVWSLFSPLKDKQLKQKKPRRSMPPTGKIKAFVAYVSNNFTNFQVTITFR